LLLVLALVVAVISLVVAVLVVILNKHQDLLLLGLHTQ
jgi:hypothetical protein